MSKIDELINKIENKSNDPYSDRFSQIDIEEIMKEYAEYYVQKCLVVAAENAETEWGYGCDYDVKIVNQSTILNINLPEHD